MSINAGRVYCFSIIDSSDKSKKKLTITYNTDLQNVQCVLKSKSCCSCQPIYS